VAVTYVEAVLAGLGVAATYVEAVLAGLGVAATYVEAVPPFGMQRRYLRPRATS
jgi:hypothetical protein